MPFTIEDFQDLLRLLEQYPEWKSVLRASLLGNELLQLPAVVRELAAEVKSLAAEVRALAEAQRRTEQRVEELAEAQRRTEQRVEELAEAQRRTEQRVEELAEAQRRTEQRVEELAEAQRRTEQRVEELAEAQRRTEQRVEELAEAQTRTEHRLGRLEVALGLTVEEHAEDILRLVLQEKGFRLLEDPRPIVLDGEVDLAAPCEDPAGRRFVVLLEAKVRLTVSALRRWAQRAASSGFRQRLLEAGLPGPYLMYVFGLRADRAVEEEARRTGVGLLGSRGEVVPPAAEGLP